MTDLFLDIRSAALDREGRDLTLLRACLDDYEEKGVDTTRIKELIERITKGETP